MTQRHPGHTINLRSLAAVAFDLDGTLYPEHRMLLPTLSVAARHPRILYSFSRVRKEVRRVSGGEADFRRRQATLMARHLGWDVDRAVTVTERIIYGRWLDALSGMRLFPGLKELILQLRHKGLKTALVSDMPIAKKMGYLGIEDLWDCAYSSEETGALKPDPRALGRMLATLDLDPSTVIYIGNSHAYDVLGARALGMVTGLISSRRIRENQADVVFRDYPAMRDFLISLITA